MRKHAWTLVALAVVAALLLDACAPTPTPAPTPAPAATQVPAAATKAPQPTAAPKASVINIVHYFSAELGLKGMTQIFTSFNAANPQYKVVDNTTGHEDFKTQILVMLAGDNPPDIFSYWEGARTQFVVDSGRLQSLDQFWADNKLDEIIPASVKAAGMHNGHIYAIPMNVHIVGFFYNPRVMEKAGVKETPNTWEELLAACEKIKASGVAPFALGSKNRWPAQYWFDYTVSRTAGPEYREKLMAGKAAYTDPEVVKAMELWKTLVDKGYFVKDANAYDWTDAADQVAKGQAAMTLMGTWICGYWDSNGLKAGTDYDFFPFPLVDPKVPVAVHGTVDGWEIPANSKNPEGAKALILHMLKPDNQALWAKAQGALAAVKNVPADTYSSVQKKCADYLGTVQFLGGYDLSTTPPMAEGGLDMFAKFMNDASKYKDYLKETEAVAKDVFK